MGQPVVHFEIIGTDPERLRGYYRELFGWEFDVGGPVAPGVSEAGNYGFTDTRAPNDQAVGGGAGPRSAEGGAADGGAGDAGDGGIPGGVGIPGGIGGGPGYDGRVLFYVGVPVVEAALRKAESLGGTRRMGPERAPGRDLVVAHVADPEGHLIGLAGPA